MLPRVGPHLHAARDNGQSQAARLLDDEALVGVARRAAQVVIDMGANQLRLERSSGLEGHENVQKSHRVGPAGDGQQNPPGPGEQAMPVDELDHSFLKPVRHLVGPPMKTGLTRRQTRPIS